MIENDIAVSQVIVDFGVSGKVLTEYLAKASTKLFKPISALLACVPCKNIAVTFWQAPFQNRESRHHDIFSVGGTAACYLGLKLI